jgi:hypothetical protein
MVVDPVTGQHVLKMTTKQKVGEESIEDILRLACINNNFVALECQYLIEFTFT